jgi:hypothetical protein
MLNGTKMMPLLLNRSSLLFNFDTYEETRAIVLEQFLIPACNIIFSFTWYNYSALIQEIKFGTLFFFGGGGGGYYDFGPISMKGSERLRVSELYTSFWV